MVLVPINLSIIQVKQRDNSPTKLGLTTTPNGFLLNIFLMLKEFLI
jgi:hypothetical protein